MQKVRAEIHLNHIRRNAEKFSSLTQRRLCAVVKANAYGHGAEEVVAALAGRADCFAVALIEEGLAIRAAAQGKDILVFTPPLCEEEVYTIAAGGLIASVPDLYTAKLCVAVCQKFRLSLRVHLKVNTGMNRYGMNLSMLGKVCKLFSQSPCVRVEGVYSHLYTCARDIAEKQRELFVRMRLVCKGYFPNAIAHLGATYGALLGERYAFDMLRVGIGLYGYLPGGLSGKTEEIGKSLTLEKGMTVYAVTAAKRKYAFGGAGYGEANLQGVKEVAVCRFGYADGFLRKKENGVNGWQGQINDLCMDVSLRKDGKRGVWTPILTDADEIARLTGTISYEVLCAATRRAEFIYDYE